MHLPDIYIVKPIFYDGAAGGLGLLRSRTTRDVGGIVAGSNALGAHEIYQEGLRLPYREVHRGRQAVTRRSGTWWRPTCACPTR